MRGALQRRQRGQKVIFRKNFHGENTPVVGTDEFVDHRAQFFRGHMRQGFMVALRNPVNVDDARPRQGGLQISDRVVSVEPEMTDIHRPAGAGLFKNEVVKVERIAFQVFDSQFFDPTRPFTNQFQGLDSLRLPALERLRI